jgi:hypothetical protein
MTNSYYNRIVKKITSDHSNERRTMISKSKIFITVGVLILLVGITIGACSQVSVGESSGKEQLDVPPALIEPTDVPVEVARAIVDPASTNEMVSEDVVVSECLVCHIDKQMLIDTAKPEEEVESENEGEG